MTRQQLIHKARRFRKLALVFEEIRNFFRKTARESIGEEVFLDTEAGKVRTLWYGFNRAESAPVLFDLHGGGFILGRAEMDEAMNLEINRRVGCKVISIDYAKAPEHPYPAALNQVYAVVKHVHQNAEGYLIDRNRMAIGGHSAGGNLSAATCMRAGQEGQFQFVCQVLDYPPLDLATSPFDKPKPKGCIPPHIAEMFDVCYVDPARSEDPLVSPIYATNEDLAGLPPALLILAGRDSLYREGRKYLEMLKAAGVPAEGREFPDAAHGFTYEASADAAEARAKMAAFLTKYLRTGV